MRTHRLAVLAAAFVILTLAAPAARAAPLRVVTTLPAYASIAKFVGGDRVTVEAISAANEDAHFVKPKPSFAILLKSADLFVTTGLDLELWAPILVDKSGNRSIRDGQAGFVAAAPGVPLLDVPESASRAGGDVHIYGNPHIHTSPLNAKIVAANIAAGLERVDPASSAAYRANLELFERRIDRELYGDVLVELLGAETLDPLTRQGQLIEFLETNEYEGAALLDRLGGWLGKALPIRGKEIVAYHKNWIYFTDLLGLRVAEFVERKPGIPPSARHVHELLGMIEDREIGVLLAASYFSHRQINTIAERSGCTAVIVDLSPTELTADSYFALVGQWLDRLVVAFSE